MAWLLLVPSDHVPMCFGVLPQDSWANSQWMHLQRTSGEIHLKLVLALEDI